jgi:hypothetical protein
MTTALRKRLQVSDWTTLKFGDRDVQAQVVNIHRGWILARVNDPEITCLMSGRCSAVPNPTRRGRRRTAPVPPLP